jgi:hypothetical protein
MQLTIGRNSVNINGASADFTILIKWSGLTLVYVDATEGWKSVGNILIIKLTPHNSLQQQVEQ